MNAAKQGIRAVKGFMIAATLMMALIIGMGIYESYRAKKINLIGMSEAFFVTSRTISDFERLKLAATRAKLSDPDLGGSLSLAFDMTRTRMSQLEFETRTVDPDSRFMMYYADVNAGSKRLEEIMGTPSCDTACLGTRLLPELEKIRRNLAKMRGAGLTYEVAARDYMAELHTATIRKILGVATLFSLLTGSAIILLHRQNTRLWQQRDRAEESERRILEISDYRAQFLAGMSHEFRTPLNAIKGFSQFLLMDNIKIAEEVRYEYIRDIEKSARDLEGMTDTVLDLAKIDAGTFELYEESVDLCEVVAEVVRQFASEANRLDVAMPNSVKITCDKAAIKRCVQNLISNALKFSDEAVRVSVQQRNGGVELSVADSGIGIASNEITEIWTPYRRSSQTRASDKQGTGLGLPITKELVALHGGTIIVNSQVNSGTTFSIKLPPTIVAQTDRRAEPGSTLSASKQRTAHLAA